MVAPVVLITVGGVLVNGTVLAWNQVTSRVFDLTDERATLVCGPHGELLDAAGLPEADRDRLSACCLRLTVTALHGIIGEWRRG